MLLHSVAVLVVLLSPGFKNYRLTYKIIDLGAKGDGKAITTTAINEAITTKLTIRGQSILKKGFLKTKT